MQDVWSLFVQETIKLNLQTFGDEFMKKYGLRFTLFVLSFTFGIGFVWLIGLFSGNRNSCTADFFNSSFENNKIALTERKTGLEIRFKEFVRTKHGIAADFEITNHDYEFYSFRAFPGESENLTFNTHPRAKVDGREIYEFTCGMGMKDFILKSGETRIFSYYGYSLANNWQKGKSLQISFYFKKENEVNGKEYWTEKLPFTEEVEKQLLKQRKEYGID